MVSSTIYTFVLEVLISQVSFPGKSSITDVSMLVSFSDTDNGLHYLVIVVASSIVVIFIHRLFKLLGYFNNEGFPVEEDDTLSLTEENNARKLCTFKISESKLSNNLKNREIDNYQKDISIYYGTEFGKTKVSFAINFF